MKIIDKFNNNNTYFPNEKIGLIKSSDQKWFHFQFIITINLI